MSHSSDARWRKLNDDLSALLAAAAPDWTNPSDRDPGITLLELFEFLGESILERADRIPEARARLRDLLDRLERAADRGCDDGTLTRNRYFTGKVLTAEDLAQEQAYHRTKHRRHNRLLHGVGIVRGLGVALEAGAAGGEPSVVVSPGVAIGPDGEELLVCESVTRDPCPSGSACYVTLALDERPVSPTPDGEPSRIEESAAVTVSEEVQDGGLAIARLVRVDDAWRIDPSFRAKREDRG